MTRLPLPSRLPAALCLAAALVVAPALAAVPASVAAPVKVVPDGRLDVAVAAGHGELPLKLSRDWTTPQPDIERALILIHGWSRRGVDDGDAAAARAGDAAAHTLVVAPLFPIPADIEGHALPASVLRWGVEDWKSGRPALAPAPVSAFDAVDAIVGRLADKRLFPHLRTIVIAGHSAGGQLVQRYAAVGHANVRAGTGIAVRYVVANPSSYLYFGNARPKPLAPDDKPCHAVDHWPYGFEGRLPAYVQMTPAQAEATYVAQDLVYLLGTDDVDPRHPELDKSCAAETQGATRLERGRAYVAALRAREGGLASQRIVEVPGVGHHGRAMFTSAAGVAVLFGEDGRSAP